MTQLEYSKMLFNPQEWASAVNDVRIALGHYIWCIREQKYSIVIQGETPSCKVD